MEERRRRVHLFGILAVGLTLAGCVTIGRPLPDSFSGTPSDRVRLLAQRSEIPIVPVPPPPLGRSDGADSSSPSKPPAPAPAMPPASLDPPLSKPAPAPLPASPPAAPLTTPPAPAAPAASKTVPARTVSADSASAPAPTTSASSAASSPSTSARPTVKQLYQDAQAKYAGIDSYIVRLSRREMVKEKTNPDEIILFKFRKRPWSVYLKWLGKEGQGREVTYCKGQHEGKIHTLLAAGDIPFVPAGRRMALAPDNLLVRSATRHPITEAGIGASVERVGVLLAAQQAGDSSKGTLRVVGPFTRAEFEQPVYAVQHDVPVGADSSLPKGGQRLYFMHPEMHLPMLVLARDERGREVEYYHYDRLQAGVKLDDFDFDPERLWSKSATTQAAGR